MSNYFRGLGYNKYSTFQRDGRDGKVEKEDFSIDGRSWNYRDPRNQRMIDSYNSTRERGQLKYNPKSNPKFDALYDYDFGTVRDAAKQLGIGNVDKKSEVKDIIDYIQGGSKAVKEEPTQQPEQDTPEVTPFSQPDPRTTGQPSANQQEYDDTRMTNPGNESPRPMFSDDPMKDAMNYGADLTSNYEKKFIPSLLAEAKLASEEIGESTRYNISNFVGKVPKLGDPRQMFDYYSDEIFGSKKDDD